MASMREFRGEDHCYQKEQRHISHLLKGLCRLMGQKLNYLEDLIPVLSGVKLTKYLKKRSSHQQSNLWAPVMFWKCFAASWPGPYVIIDGTIKSALYQKIRKENVRASVCAVKLKSTWIIQQDNDPKHAKIVLKVWIYPIEQLWHDFKQSVHAEKPSNIANAWLHFLPPRVVL